MAQIVLDIDQPILEKIEKVAERKKISISNWVGDNIKKILENDYPEDFFELFGAINDETFIEPDEIDPKFNLSRERV
jgi:predicted methyltransferase